MVNFLVEILAVILPVALLLYRKHRVGLSEPSCMRRRPGNGGAEQIAEAGAELQGGKCHPTGLSTIGSDR